MSALFDFPSLIVVLLLFICVTTHARTLRPALFDTPSENPNEPNEHKGLLGFCWKMSRVGERVSEYVAVSCVIMAFYVIMF